MTTKPVASLQSSSIIEVHLADGTCRSVRVDSQTSVQKILEVVLGALGIQPLSFPQFALRLSAADSADYCHWLHPCIKMPELRRRYCAPAGLLIRFELRIRFLLSDMHEMCQTQMSAFLYLYDQLVGDYLKHVAWKIDSSLALQMAALMLRKRFSTVTSETLEKKLDFGLLEQEGGMVKYLPEALIINTKRKQLRKSILHAVHKVICLTRLECVFRFMKLLADITPFDVEVFRASLGSGWSVTPTEVHVGCEVGIACLGEHSAAAVSLSSLQSVRSVFLHPLEGVSHTVVKLSVTAGTTLTFTLPTVSIAESFAHLVDGYHRLLAAPTAESNQRAWLWPDYSEKTGPIEESDGVNECPAHSPLEVEEFQEGDYATPMSRDLQIDRHLIQLQELLGDGQFGNVYRGVYGKGRQAVAVKVCKAENDVYDTSTANKFLLDEAYTMAQFRHPHIVKLVGLCVSPLVWIVMELAALGQLRAYLVREKGAIDLDVQLGFAHQLASALAYLHSRHFLHRDIAARNVLVATPHCVKLSDFGLSKMLGNDSIYTASKGKLPIKWLPPESINYRKFSTQSDVYMFGVCMWEILSFGVKPWQGVRNHEVVVRLEQGELLEQPAGCPITLYALLKSVWLLDHRLRPSMLEVKNFLANLLHQIDGQVLKKSVDEQVGYAQVNKLYSAKSTSALKVESFEITTCSLQKALEEQRQQCDEDDKWLEEVEEKLLPPEALNCRKSSEREEYSVLTTCVPPKLGELDREGDSVHQAVLTLVQTISLLSSNYSSQMPNADFLLSIQEVSQKTNWLLDESELQIKDLSEADHKQVALIRILLESDLRNLSRLVEKMVSEVNPTSYFCDLHKKELLKVTHMLAVNSKHLLDTVDTARINSGTAVFKQIDKNNNL